MKGLTKKTLSGVVWTATGTLANHVLRIVLVVVLARLLTPAEFGVAAAALVVVRFAQTFSELGLAPAIVQREELTPAHVRTGFSVSLGLSALLTIASVASAPLIARAFRMPELTDVVRVIGVMFLFKGLSTISLALAQRAFAFRTLAIINTVAFALGYGVVSVSLAYAGYGVWAIVIGHVTQAALEMILYLVVQPVKVSFGVDRAAFRDLIGFGAGMTIARFANYFARNADYFIVGNSLGPAALGFYNRAFELIKLPSTLFEKIVGVVLFPAMAKIQNEPARLGNAFRRALFGNAVLILPASVVCVVYAPELIALLLGDQWGEAVDAFQILSIGMLFRTSYKVSGIVVRATAAVYRAAVLQLLYAVLVVAGSLAGLPYGIEGVAVGTLTAVSIHFFLLTALGMSIANLSWVGLARAHTPGLLLAAIAGAVAAGLAAPLRGGGLPPAAVLSAGAGAAAIACSIVVAASRGRVLGEDGRWWAESIRSYIGRKRAKTGARP